MGQGGRGEEWAREGGRRVEKGGRGEGWVTEGGARSGSGRKGRKVGHLGKGEGRRKRRRQGQGRAAQAPRGSTALRKAETAGQARGDPGQGRPGGA